VPCAHIYGANFFTRTQKKKTCVVLSHSAILCSEERRWELLHDGKPRPFDRNERAFPRAPQEEQGLELLHNLKVPVGGSALVSLTAVPVVGAPVLAPTNRQPRALGWALVVGPPLGEIATLAAGLAALVSVGLAAIAVLCEGLCGSGADLDEAAKDGD
jgi:hypothetical protein